jgi:hypothetical protein
MALGVEEAEVVLPSAILELVHTTTILHDDVIDQADSRRGKATVNAALKSRVAVFAADLLFGEAMARLSRWGAARGPWGKKVERCFHKHIRAVLEGEMVQDLVMGVGEAPSLEACVAVARGNTGALFALSFGVPGVLAQLNEASQNWLENAGAQYGTLFQLVDDVDDVVEDTRMALPEGGFSLRQWTYASSYWKGVDRGSFDLFLLGKGEGPSPSIRRGLVQSITQWQGESARALGALPDPRLAPVAEIWGQGSGALLSRIGATKEFFDTPLL